MAKIKTHNVFILKKLVEAGYKEKKDIVKISLHQALRIPNFNRNDLEGICDLQDALAKDDLLPFLIEDTDEAQTEEEFTREIGTNGFMV